MSVTVQLDRYLSVRRSLGYDLGTAERILCRFTRFADREGAVHIDTALFLRWHATLAEACTSTRAARLTVVRLFAQWLSSFDPEHEVPPRGLLPGSVQRSRPHIYTDDEIGTIIAAAKELPSIYGLRGLTSSTLFGLIAVTGLRISEALALDRDDLDTVNGVLRVRQGKLGKERLLPLDPTVVGHLIDYLAERDRLIVMRPCRCSLPTKPHASPTVLPDTTSRGPASRLGSGPISHTASMGGDRASTIFATASQ